MEDLRQASQISGCLYPAIKLEIGGKGFMTLS
jgi:hypothetical protein